MITKGLIFVNGVFDLLHPGHIKLLEEAAKLTPVTGGKLVVGINSDESVRHLKGPTRPVFGEAARAYMLESLWMVDEVRVFDGDTPAKLIEELKPEIVVKGEEYRGMAIPEEPLIVGLGGKVVYVASTPGWSTTEVVGAVRGGRTCL